MKRKLYRSSVARVVDLPHRLLASREPRVFFHDVLDLRHVRQLKELRFLRIIGEMVVSTWLLIIVLM